MPEGTIYWPYLVPCHPLGKRTPCPDPYLLNSPFITSNLETWCWSRLRRRTRSTQLEGPYQVLLTIYMAIWTDEKGWIHYTWAKRLVKESQGEGKKNWWKVYRSPKELLKVTLRKALLMAGTRWVHLWAMMWLLWVVIQGVKGGYLVKLVIN
jgi:hypothetical protein